MIGSDHDTVWPGTERPVTAPAYEALHAFDANNGTKPSRVIAEDIARQYFDKSTAMGAVFLVSLTDKIQHAIEDARKLGKLRGLLELAAKECPSG